VVAFRAAAAATVCIALAMLSGPSALADRSRDEQWYLGALRVPDAQRISKGAGVTVAVIDSGVWAGHPDLKGAVLAGTNILGNGGDGRTDNEGHGTAMAGIIAGRGVGGSNSVLGLAPAAQILPVRPTGSPLLVARAIEWAVDHGATVINMSFKVQPTPGLERAIQDAAAADVVLVGAAGNTGDGANDQEYPAAYPEVLAVVSTDRAGAIESSSQHGSQVDLAAPGVAMLTADGQKSTGYAVTSGTSDAAAVVSGAAALIRAEYPNLSAAQVVQRLTSTAVDKGAPGRDDAYGYGELDLMAALTAKSVPAASSPAPGGSQDAVAADPDSGAGGSRVRSLLFVGIGVVLLGAVLAVVLMRMRRRI
jgi:type VII secretion-associated serine protease mycosin